jgi:small subunit ribosomal protein S16
MVRIRFRRVGSRHQPYYRIVVADRESPRNGRFLEILGNLNPRTEPATIEIDEARLFHWLKRGAQPSDSLVKVLKTNGTWDRWERYKTGEELGILLEEARENFTEVDQRTRRDDLFATRRRKKGEAKEAPVEKVEEKEEEKTAQLEGEPAISSDASEEQQAEEEQVDEERVEDEPAETPE